MSILGAALAPLAAAALLAQPPASEMGSTMVEGVTVTSPRRDALPTFVDELAVPSLEGRFAGQLPRWNKPVCPGVMGTTPKASDYLIARISQVAREAGVEVGAAGCRPNLIVAVTREGDRLAETLGRKHRFRLFGRGRHQELAAFRRGSRPVRWWHLTELGTADGVTAPQGAPVKNGTSVPFVRDKGTRLQANTRENIKAVLVVIDSEQTRGVPAQALSAYVAMVGLARLPQQPDLRSASTILTVFSDLEARRPAPGDLTAYDRAYLTSLYAIRPDLRFGRQRDDLERRMRRELGPGG